MKKKWLAVALSTILASSACAFSACKVNEPTAQPSEPETMAYVNLDINPSIELIVDKDGKVVSVRGENEDGLVLLYKETGIEGEQIDVAVQKITDLAIRYGYLDEYNKVVDTLVTSGDNEFATEILGKVNTSVTATAQSFGLTITTDGEGAYSLLRRLNEFKAKFPNNEAIQNLSVAKFKLALSASETGEISLEAATELDDAQLVALMSEISPQIEEYATQAYLAAKTKALAAYEQATELAAYGVYTTYYAQHVLSHPLTAYYGGVYQMYATAAKGFDVICDVAELTTEIKTYPLTEEQIQAIVTALGMESADELKDANGNVTIESVEAFADKLFKNSPASAALEEKKAALTEALAQAEIVLKEKAAEAMEEYRPQIEAAIDGAKTVLATVQGIYDNLPDAILTIFGDCTTDFREILSEIDAMLEDGTIEVEELRRFSDRLEEKAQSYLTKIEQDLSEEELAEIEAQQTKIINKMTAQKEAFSKALDEAAATAKEYLQRLKDSRLPAQE